MTVSNATQSVANEIITIDRRRGDRRQADENAQTVTNPPKPKKQRRRHIDPTTCERDYSGDEIEFMRAMDDYKRDSGRQFPTCSEVLEVIRSLGYFKLSEEEMEQLGFELVDVPCGDSDAQDDESDDDFGDE